VNKFGGDHLMLKTIEKLVFLSLLFCIQCKTVSGKYALVFGQSYVEAIQHLEKEQGKLEAYFPGADDRLAASAIVFPELIRYSALRDKVETAALKTLYVQYGKQYANFSIGYFQMKPSFAEEVEKAWMNHFPETSIVFDTLQNAENRLKRVERLSKQRGQSLYLFCFYRYMQERLKSIPGLTNEDQIRLLATAYNRGFMLPIEELEKHSRDCIFYTTLWPSHETPRYNYASIALEYYSQQKETLSTKGP
jgi:hypothetical protein